MKVRSYKGRSLEKIYGSIKTELGPEAVIVSTNQEKKRSLLGFVTGAASYEVVAVVEDSSAKSPAASGAARSEELHRMALMQAHKWQQFESSMDEMQSQLSHLSHRMVPPAAVAMQNGEALPEYARDWDPRFRERLLPHCPEALAEGGEPFCREWLPNLLNVAKQFQVKQEKGPPVIVLSGPTGSGKTTTLAKLAAQWSLDDELNIGIITTDTYRVAAVDQVREYATLLGVELKVAFSAAEAARAVESFSDKDVILVDTPGRSHYDKAGIKALKGILSGMGLITVLMVLPATVDRRDVPGIIEHFGVLGIDSLVITKIDETRRYDLLTTVVCETDRPIAFFADGQRVPQDLRRASMADAVDMLVPEGI